MDYSISISNSANKDIDDIHRYISVILKVPKVADEISNNIYAKIQTLDMMPKRSEPKMIPGLPPIYYVHARNFVICYFVNSDTVKVFAVLYNRRDLTSVLKSRTE